MPLVKKAKAERLASQTIQGSPIRTRLGLLGREHGIPLLIYLLLSIALTWPLIRDFATALTGIGDAEHHLWILWHTKEALLGREPLFSTSLLYYPKGITLLTHSLGPVAGLLALPFWPWGPEAAYNGAALIGFWLTGYFMYLLARTLGFRRGVAFFAGMVLLVAPRHVSSVAAGHLTKVFLGAIPLVLLALHRALDLKRSAWWAVATAFALLLALLYSSEQFVFAGLAGIFFSLAAWFRAEPTQRWPLLRRGAVIVATVLIVSGPMLLLILSVANDPAIVVDKSLEAFQQQPDLVQLFMPAKLTSRLFGPLFHPWLDSLDLQVHETAVFLSWTSLLLCAFALVSRKRRARPWLLFTFLCVILALGPELHIWGENRFTKYELPIVLPYAFLTSLPGLDFLRSPARFMLIGYVGLGIAASFGLTAIAHRLSKPWRTAAVVFATALVLLEGWPLPPPQERLRLVPEFYRQIARHDEMYGVFDLPIRPAQVQTFLASYVHYSSHYQIYQMTHGKGIAAGYVSRPYTKHPLFDHFMNNSPYDSPVYPDILVNGEPVDHYAHIELELARNNYRYVVRHKPRDWYPIYTPGSWGDLAAEEFVERVFGERDPIVDDDLVTVYTVSPLAQMMSLSDASYVAPLLGDGWSEQLEGSADAGLTWRWATSPAELLVYSLKPQEAQLEITPTWLHDPGSENRIGQEGTLFVTTSDRVSQTLALEAGQPATADITLEAGDNVITLTLESGNFRPIDVQSDSEDQRLLSFALAEINIVTR